jgi:type I restriction enzyme, S subunit
MSEWKETDIGVIPAHWAIGTLGEISHFITDGAHLSPKPTNSKYYMASVKDMRYNYFEFSNCKTISEEDFETLDRGKCSPEYGDILLSKDGANCLDLVFVYKQPDKIVLLSSIAIARLKKQYNCDFYRYYLLSPVAQEIMRNNYVSGSAIPRVILKDFKNVPVPIIPTDEQNAIASILTSLDDKIDLLHRQNKTLEKMAETLFRQWFVEAPKEEWEEGTLSKYISVKHGYAFKGEDIITDCTNNILVTPGNFNIGGGFKSDKFKYVKDITFPAAYVFSEGDLVVTMTDLSVDGSTLGYPALIPKPLVTEKYLHNQRVGKIEFKDKIGKYYLYSLMKTDDYQWFILGGASGTSIRHTSPSAIGSYSFKIPPMDLQWQYESTVEGFFEKINDNSTQIRTLTSMRDNLLPKLMNGEVRVDYQEV